MNGRPGPTIKMLRIAEKITQAELSKALGISRPYLSKIENSKQDASLGLLRRIAQNLRVPLPLLFLDDFFIDEFIKAKPDLDILKNLGTILFNFLSARIASSAKINDNKKG